MKKSFLSDDWPAVTKYDTLLPYELVLAGLNGRIRALNKDKKTWERVFTISMTIILSMTFGGSILYVYGPPSLTQIIFANYKIILLPYYGAGLMALFALRRWT